MSNEAPDDFGERELCDLREGLPAGDLPDGALRVGRVGDEEVLITRQGEAVFAVGALCPHYHSPLADGVVIDGTLRCPAHHSRFCLHTGAAVGGPAFDSLSRWRVWERDGRIGVDGEPIPPAAPSRRRAAGPRRVVIVGGGAAGLASAERLRREGFDGGVTLISAEPDAPYDRPNCSKDYLAGQAPAAWMPLRERGWYDARAIDLQLGATVGRLDLQARTVVLRDGREVGYDALLLAPGAAPRRVAIPGLSENAALTLRTLADADRIIEACDGARRAAVIGAGFIGLEAAASLRARGLDVHVISPEPIPLAKVFGPQLGLFLQELHHGEGVTFHLGRSVCGYADGRLELDSGEAVAADLVVLAVGVTPRTELAAAAGLPVQDGIIVDSGLRAGAPGVYAAGDAARFPWPGSDAGARVEHWVHALRQGQHVARMILGDISPFTDAPFFWSVHYATAIQYVGHAPDFDKLKIDGALDEHDAEVTFLSGGRVEAVATLGRDRRALRAEAEFEAAAPRAWRGARVSADGRLPLD